jgi:hypothetical protein
MRGEGRGCTYSLPKLINLRHLQANKKDYHMNNSYQCVTKYSTLRNFYISFIFHGGTMLQAER